MAGAGKANVGRNAADATFALSAIPLIVLVGTVFGGRMAQRRSNIARLIGIVLGAYLLVLQAAAGGFASAAEIGMDDPLGVICLSHVADSDTPLDNEAHRSCCSLGCLGAAVATLQEPDAFAFVYAPDPVPALAWPDDELASPIEVPHVLGTPRAPPAIG